MYFIKFSEKLLAIFTNSINRVLIFLTDNLCFFLGMNSVQISYLAEIHSKVAKTVIYYTCPYYLHFSHIMHSIFS